MAPEDYGQALIESAQAHRDGRFFLEHIGLYLDVMPEIALTVYDLRRQWIEQYDLQTVPELLLADAVGKLDKAAEWYDKALALEADSVEVIGNLARTYVRDKRDDARTRQLLDELVLKDTRPEWVTWAKDRLAMMRTARQPTTQPASMD